MTLFDPVRIGALELANRLVMMPVSCNYNRDGHVTEQGVRFFAERARGGVGMIMIGDGIVDSPIGNNTIESTRIDDDAYIPTLAMLVKAIKAHGTATALQLSHGGRRSGRVAAGGRMEVTRGLLPVAPSALAHPVPGQVVPRELTAPEIEAIADRFGEGARRSREAGFDAVCLQYAHMYLGGQFLSPWANHRCDDFGGGLDGRLKFPLMVIARVRKAMGVGVPLMVRMNGEEPDGGNTAAEILEIARRFERAGVDALHISIGFGSPTRDPDLVTSIAPMRTSTAKLLEIAAGVKAAVSIPVGTANKLVEDIAAATAAVERGKIDLVGLARPLIADPDLPRKARQHRLDAIRPCIYCCRGCAQYVLEKNQPLVCTVNPLARREGAEEARGAPAGRLSVLVIGGGPAGLQAALTARECGHAVTLVDRSERLGGQLRIASLPPGKARITSLVEHLLSAVLDAGIEVVLSAGPDRIASLLDERRPDAAILATGSSPRGLELAGVERSMVVSSAEVLSGARLPPGQVVIVGGGEAGCEAAEYLARDGRRVTIVEQLPELARGLVQLSRVPLLLSLERLGVRAITAARILRVSRASMRVAVAGSEEDLPFAVLVAAVGSVPYEQDIDALVESRIAIVLRIGDRRQPRGILEAIREGHDAAMSLGTAAEGGTG